MPPLHQPKHSQCHPLPPPVSRVKSLPCSMAPVPPVLLSPVPPVLTLSPPSTFTNTRRWCQPPAQPSVPTPSGATSPGPLSCPSTGDPALPPGSGHCVRGWVRPLQSTRRLPRLSQSQRLFGSGPGSSRGHSLSPGHPCVPHVQLFTTPADGPPHTPGCHCSRFYTSTAPSPSLLHPKTLRPSPHYCLNTSVLP